MNSVPSIGGMDFVLIPFRGLDGAKQRLDDVLSPAERMELAWAMLGDVIGAVRASATAPRILIVTQNPSAVRACVASDIDVIADPSGGDLNAALDAGFRHAACRSGDDAPVLTIMADLPLLQPATVDRAFSALRERDMLVLAPAPADDGTNLFGQSAACRVRPAFGARSFRVHVSAGEALGLAVRVIEDAGADRDIDRRDDFMALAAAPHATQGGRFAGAHKVEAHAAVPT